MQEGDREGRRSKVPGSLETGPLTPHMRQAADKHFGVFKNAKQKNFPHSRSDPIRERPPLRRELPPRAPTGACCSGQAPLWRWQKVQATTTEKTVLNPLCDYAIMLAKQAEGRGLQPRLGPRQPSPSPCVPRGHIAEPHHMCPGAESCQHGRTAQGHLTRSLGQGVTEACVESESIGAPRLHQPSLVPLCPRMTVTRPFLFSSVACSHPGRAHCNSATAVLQRHLGLHL